MDFQFINDKVLNVVEALIYLLFFISLSAKSFSIRTNKLKCIIFIIFYVILLYWMALYLPRGVHSVVMLLATILLLSFITRTNFYNAAIIIIIATLFIAIIDIIVSALFIGIFGVDSTELLGHPLYYPLFAWTSKVIQVLIILLLFKYVNGRLRINVSKSINNQYMFAALQLLLMSLFVVSINYGFVGEVEDKSIYNITLVALFLLSLILSIFDIREREQILAVANKKKTLDEYVRNLEEVINVIRREKHDFMNHMQTIYAICKLGKSNALESIDSYIKRLTTDLTVSYKFFETGNDYIDGLLAIKSHKCFENDIDLSVNIGAQFSTAAADTSDIAGILGNILNNAIECLMPLPENHGKQIQIVTYIDMDRFILKIINNGPEIPKHLVGNIFEKGVTSKANSEEHGLGLFIVRQMTLKNKGSIMVSSRPERTEFNVSFNVRGNLNADNSERIIVQDQGA